VTAVFPAGEVLLVKVLADFAQFCEDFVVGKAVFEQAVDLAADGLGELGDFAVARVFLRGCGSRAGDWASVHCL
jgi:hypothetical protein